MRGDGDEPMSREANVALLERIVSDQRGMIAARGPAEAAVPQVWALYKEVQEYYEKGMRVPDDVTLLWSDDNWGNIRRLPTSGERTAAGRGRHLLPLRLRGRARARTSGSTPFRSPRSGSRCTWPGAMTPPGSGS